MRKIKVIRVIGQVKNGAHEFFAHEKILQDFDQKKISFGTKSDSLRFEENLIHWIARRRVFFTNVFGAKVNPDPAAAGGKEFPTYDDFLYCFKSYSGPSGATRPIFLIIKERWIEVGKKEFPLDDDHYLMLEYDVEGISDRLTKKLPTTNGNKVLFNKDIFNIDSKQIAPETTSRFRLFYRTPKGKTLLNTTPPGGMVKETDFNAAFDEAEAFTIRLIDPTVLQTQLSELFDSIQKVEENKQRLLETIENELPDDQKTVIYERIDALLDSLGISFESPWEKLSNFFHNTYGGQPDEDDLEAYLAKNFPAFLELLKEAEKEE